MSTLSLLPVFTASIFLDRIKKGGSTYPWLIGVEDENDLHPYVVKLFKTNHVNDAYAVSREVFGNVLAREFDLLVPKCAFIEIDDEFINELSDDLQEEIRSKDERIKFGSKYIEGAATFTQSLHKHSLESYMIEDIYAFDHLIYNIDRKNLKPNILFHENESYLIDHELSFNVNKTVIDLFNDDKLLYDSKKHIFYDYLSKKGRKDHYFSTFHEYLRNLNLGVLDPYIKQLASFDHPMGDMDTIAEYLHNIKSNSSKFISVLRKTFA
ncbi:MAG TPA: HipA family kinase [Cytophagaceae bacterium]|jgi:hypothetical protein